MSVETLQRLREAVGEVIDIRGAVSLLHWDQEVYMPPKGAAARGRQLATLSALAHRLFTDPEMGVMLSSLESATLEADDAALVAETRYDYTRATCLPEAFVETFAEEQSKAYEAWTRARAASAFSQFEPHLQKMVDLNRQKADYFGYSDTPYDALLQEYERGMSTAQLRKIFGELAPKQSALVEELVHAPNQPDLAWLDQDWDESGQWDLSLKVLRDLGYDFAAGRQDRSVHPFTINFDRDDVRITTRIHKRELFSALTGSIHEGGHALYEQGFLDKDKRTVLGESISLGIHESQSRMWENIIGRSLPFMRYLQPHLLAAFPGQLDGRSPEELYRAINHVQPSLIRVEADECTYNLHVILRFEIEVALIEGSLAVKDLPEAWNAKVKEYLGLVPPNDAEGCLQDIHWSHGSMGYFPTYALGNLYAAQFFETIEKDLPELWDQVGAGDFAPLLGWLRTHIHEVGRRKTAVQLIQDVTGKAPEAAPYLRYLKNKYLPLYSL